MTRVPLGVRADGVVLTSVQLSPKSSALESWQTVGTLHATILDRLREQPGVTSAGSTNFLPMEHGWRGPLVRGDQPPVRSEEAPQAQHHSSSEGYLETMGATLLEGRLFTAQDTATTESVVVLNETAAKRYFPGESAGGTRDAVLVLSDRTARKEPDLAGGGGRTPDSAASSCRRRHRRHTKRGAGHDGGTGGVFSDAAVSVQRRDDRHLRA